jgi:hypothetical protein
MRRSAVAAPLVRAGKTAQPGEGDDLAELLVQLAQRPDLLFEDREKLPLDLMENRRELEHAASDIALRRGSRKYRGKITPLPGF